MKKLMLMAVLLTGVAAPAAMANEKDHGMWFSKVDTNGDGKITKAEHEKASDDKFAKLDMNGDGSVTKEEAKEAKAKWKAEKEHTRTE